MGITPTKFRRSKFPGNMHNYIWCPYYLPSFMKFCSVVSEELHWQAASEVYFGKFQVQRGITPTKFRRSKFPGNMHNYIWCPYYLPSLMKFCSVVSEELCSQAASEVYFGKFLSSKRHNSHKNSGDQNFLVICTTTYGVLTTYQVSWNSVQ
jgi:prolyl-tRNA synthetase